MIVFWNTIFYPKTDVSNKRLFTFIHPLIFLAILLLYVLYGVSPTSVYRTKEYNKKIGGVTNSKHLYGCAFDISHTVSKEKLKIIFWLKHLENVITKHSHFQTF